MSSPERLTHVTRSQLHLQSLELGIEHEDKPSLETVAAPVSQGAENALEADRSHREPADRVVVSLGVGNQDEQETQHRHAEGGTQRGIQQFEHKQSLPSTASDTRSYNRDKTKSMDEGKYDELEAPRLRESLDGLYLDPTPKTPRQEVSPSRGPPTGNEVHGDDGSTSEIQSIMDQFDEAIEDSGEEEHRSSGFRTGGSLLGAPIQHPPRRSSLEPLRPANPKPANQSIEDAKLPAYQLDHTVPHEEAFPAKFTAKAPPMRMPSLPPSALVQQSDTPSSPNLSISLPKMLPPQPDPEPDLPFDFHRFLEQLRHRTADPVAKFLRSFLVEFGKKQWMVHEQVKIINDFLTFITNKMAMCEVWRGVSDAEFDNAKEGMEKLVMNRLYAQTFSPAIQPPAPLPGNKGKRKNIEKIIAPGRRGQHQEDIERDEILGQKVRIYGWVQEDHLDIPAVGDSGRRFLLLAQQGTALSSALSIRRYLYYHRATENQNVQGSA